MNDTDITYSQAGSLCPVEEYRPIDAALIELRRMFSGVVYDVASSEGMRAARLARAELRRTRTTLEKRRQELKAPALERCRLIDSEAKRITAAIRELEDPIDQQIEAEEKRLEAARLERQARERQRLAAIHDRLIAINALIAQHAMSSAAAIETAIEQLRRAALTADEYGDMLPLAEATTERTLAQLHVMRDAALAREAHEAALAAERARLVAEAAERERAEAEARAAHEAALAAERAERERIEAEARRRRIQAATLEAAALAAVTLLEEHGLGGHEVTLSLRVALGLPVDI